MDTVDLLGRGAIVLGAFIAMEPVTYLVHRAVMHGAAGWRLHRSHHRGGLPGEGPSPRRFEANDAFPVAFASVVVAGLWVGFHHPGAAGLVPLGVGVTAYGLVYALVHDGAIHGRIPVPAWARRLTRPLAAAHRLHHQFGGEPYGMLLPFVPAAVRRRAEQVESVASHQSGPDRAAAQPTGSTPSQVPADA